ncbi:MAG: hypothetical protein J5654_01620 [Victivallales bacterium]|nr:hypothetical protein [Victivallales bacterium]
MSGEATMLRTSGCPVIGGSKGCLSAVSPGALRRPLRVRRLRRHGQGRSGSPSATASGCYCLRHR